MITSDDITKYGFPWKMIDQYDPSNEVTIINTDTTGAQGVHWITAIALGNTLYIYDPLGPDNNRVTSAGVNIDSIIERKARANRLRVYYYPHESQMRDNDLCGYHALFVAQLIKRAIDRGSELSPSNVDGAIRKVFGRGADLGDVAVLRRAFA